MGLASKMLCSGNRIGTLARLPQSPTRSRRLKRNCFDGVENGLSSVAILPSCKLVWLVVVKSYEHMLAKQGCLFNAACMGKCYFS